MTTFFSKVQNKFKAEFHGRYLGHILETIAEVQPMAIFPIIRNAKLSRRWPGPSIGLVSTETRYLQGEGIITTEDRAADLEITTADRSARIVVEIKVEDKFLPGQLEAYAKWAQNRNQAEDRAVVILTAYPLDKKSEQFIEDNSRSISRMYLSDFVAKLDPSLNKSELIGLLKNYLSEKGYSMYQLEGGVNSLDYKALRSFMVLNFLPHLGGHGRQSTKNNIARGPVVFSNLVQNWQLVSKRFSNALKFTRAPTVRYYPEQIIGALPKDIQSPSEEQLMLDRKNSRSKKMWGRYWLSADCTFGDIYRLEWGKILQIENGTKNGEIKCGIYAFFKKDGGQLSTSQVKWLTDGVGNQALYSPEKFMKILHGRVDIAEKSIINNKEMLMQIPWNN